MHPRAALPWLLALALAACGGSDDDRPARTGTSAPARRAAPPPPMPRRVGVAFRAPDGRPVRGLFAPAGPRAPGLVLVHQSDGTARQWDAFVPYLHRAGFAALAYGGRGGVDEAQLAPEARGALAFLRRRPDVDPLRLGLVGASIGADVALLVARGRPGREIRGAVALSPAGSTTQFRLQGRRAWHPHDVLMVSDESESSVVDGALPGARRSRRLVTKVNGHGVALLADPHVRAAVLAWLESRVR